VSFKYKKCPTGFQGEQFCSSFFHLVEFSLKSDKLEQKILHIIFSSLSLSPSLSLPSLFLFLSPLSLSLILSTFTSLSLTLFHSFSLPFAPLYKSFIHTLEQYDVNRDSSNLLNQNLRLLSSIPLFLFARFKWRLHKQLPQIQYVSPKKFFSLKLILDCLKSFEDITRVCLLGFSIVGAKSNCHSQFVLC
jgi:hypothetical protein